MDCSLPKFWNLSIGIANKICMLHSRRSLWPCAIRRGLCDEFVQLVQSLHHQPQPNLLQPRSPAPTSGGITLHPSYASAIGRHQPRQSPNGACCFAPARNGNVAASGKVHSPGFPLTLGRAHILRKRGTKPVWPMAPTSAGLHFFVKMSTIHLAYATTTTTSTPATSRAHLLLLRHLSVLHLGRTGRSPGTRWPFPSASLFEAAPISRSTPRGADKPA